MSFADESSGGEIVQKSYGWLSLLPALIAIALALIVKEVISSLVLGITAGTIILSLNSEGLFHGLFLRLPNTLVESLADSDHMSVVLFSLLIGATVHVISKNGGMMALVKIISRRAQNARTGQLASYFLGLLIFFDDYANTMVVGNTMRPVTDRLKISREKLAYIVDSTAAPIAAIAFITTWIGAELGYIQDGLNSVSEAGGNLGSAYGVFLQSLSYSFYPILTLIFMFMLIWSKKDFGPMLKAERIARSAINNKTLKTEPAEFDEIPDDKENIWNAIIPVLVIVFGTLAGLIYTGSKGVAWNESAPFGNNLSGIIGAADSYKALVWSSFGGLLTAVMMTVLSRVQKLKVVVENAIDGIKFMIPAIAILALAWTLASITKELDTATYLAGLLGEGFKPQFLPAIVFVLSGLIAFATGTSWGTMAILYPLVLFSSWEIASLAGWTSADVSSLFANVVACVLAGSVLGDHCSPISDTTILSSLATECDHVEHVRTQLPYALVVGTVALLVGIIPAGFGLPTWISFAIAIIILYSIVSYFGKMAALEEEPL